MKQLSFGLSVLGATLAVKVTYAGHGVRALVIDPTTPTTLYADTCKLSRKLFRKRRSGNRFSVEHLPRRGIPKWF
jgi:hypothetical protein